MPGNEARAAPATRTARNDQLPAKVTKPSGVRVAGDVAPALDAALRYAAADWVFPCKPGSKEPATLHGFKDATTDPGRIRRWWTSYPRSTSRSPPGHQSPGGDRDVERRAARPPAADPAPAVVASLNPWSVAGSLLPGLHGNAGQPAAAYRSAASSAGAASPVYSDARRFGDLGG